MTASALASLLGDRSIAAAVIFALCNVGEPLLVAWLIKQRFGNDFKLESLHSVLGFFAAAGIGPAISGSVATVGFILFYSSGAPILATWLNWFASDALGIIR
jgi:integral membrane sensor domain MASE1